MFRLIALLAATSLQFSLADSGKGYITPASVTITFTRMSLGSASGRGASLLEGTYTREFKKDGADFTASSLASIKMPEGNWTKVQVCYSTTYKVKVSGDIFSGASGTAFANGSAVYSVGTDGRASGALSATEPSGGATELSFLVDSNGKTEYCGDTYYERPICIATDKAKCEAEALHLSPTEQAPDLNLLLNLTNLLEVDSDSGTITMATGSPHPFLGKPGAAIHLTYSSGDKRANVSMLFSPEKKMSVGFSFGVGGTPSGFCNGYSAPTLTATGSLKIITSLDTITGRAQFPAAQCGNSSVCHSVGMLVMDNILKGAGSTVTVTCVADSAAYPPYLGQAYTGGAGVSGYSQFTIQRIVDPGNIFGICASGTCGGY